ncbi:Uncharacterised protein [Bordetella pertussis]|nr:Uncharacterised protein [Bordetella pertussis]
MTISGRQPPRSRRSPYRRALNCSILSRRRAPLPWYGNVAYQRYSMPSTFSRVSRPPAWGARARMCEIVLAATFT